MTGFRRPIGRKIDRGGPAETGRGAREGRKRFCPTFKVPGRLPIGTSRSRPGGSRLLPILTPLRAPRESHAYGSDVVNPWSLFWFHFRGRNAEELLEWTDFSPETRVMTCAAWDGTRRQFHSLFNSLERGYHDHNLLEMSRILINVITLLHRNSSRERPQEARDRIEQAMDRMRKTLTSPLTLEGYAREAGYSVPRYCHWFKHFTGVSSMAYLTELRIQSACEYLDTTSLNIKQIAATLGYDDPYYFSRAFAKCTGQSPMKYRDGGERAAVPAEKTQSPGRLLP